MGNVMKWSRGWRKKTRSLKPNSLKLSVPGNQHRSNWITRVAPIIASHRVCRRMQHPPSINSQYSNILLSPNTLKCFHSSSSHNINLQTNKSSKQVSIWIFKALSRGLNPLRLTICNKFQWIWMALSSITRVMPRKMREHTQATTVHRGLSIRKRISKTRPW